MLRYRDISNDFINHLAESTTTLSHLWKITRTDNTSYYFTDADKDIVYDGNTYKTSNSGELSELEYSTQLNPDNFDFDMILSSTDIDKDDVVAGLFDHADVYVYLINREDTSMGVVKLARGKLGKVTILEDDKASAEFRSMAQLLSQGIGRVYSHECDADLGDSRCGVNLASYTYTGTVTSVTNNRTFNDSACTEANDYFNYGLLTWTSGNNNGLEMEVKSYEATGGVFTLMSPMPFTVQVGDGFSAYRGCDKTKTTCKDTFSNYVNFRGFANIPGMDKVQKVPDVNEDAGLHD